MTTKRKLEEQASDREAEETTDANIELARQTDAAGETREETRLERVSDGEVTEHPTGEGDPDAEEKAERILRDGLIWL